MKGVHTLTMTFGPIMIYGLDAVILRKLRISVMGTSDWDEASLVAEMMK